MWGSFLWVMFDFGSAGRHEGDTDGINDKGLVTRDRSVKKDAFYYYKANWNPEAMVYITSRRDDQRTSPATAIKVYSNCEKITLKINGKSLGELTKKADRVYVRDNVTLSDGANLVEAEGSLDGKIARDACNWTYKPAAAKGN
jgi:beta-galactosidase